MYYFNTGQILLMIYSLELQMDLQLEIQSTNLAFSTRMLNRNAKEKAHKSPPSFA